MHGVVETSENFDLDTLTFDLKSDFSILPQFDDTPPPGVINRLATRQHSECESQLSNEMGGHNIGYGYFIVFNKSVSTERNATGFSEVTVTVVVT